MSSSLVLGVGVNDRKYPMAVSRKHIKEYAIWYGFLLRCYSPRVQGKQPTYVGCSTSENFKSYSYFYRWCQNQVGFGFQGFQLDKDLLIKGNKVYSEDNCLFLPQELNKLLISSRACRGSLPIGVCISQNRFLAQYSIDSVSKHIGLFDTPEEAHNAYKKAKESHIKLQAEKWKDQIDIRAYEALMRYEVLSTD